MSELTRNEKELRERLRLLGPFQEVDGYELCGCCDGLSPGLGGREQIVHCPVRRHVKIPP
jgi:hypothetical protein